MSVVENNALDAIEIIVDEAIRNAGYDKTIQAQVVSCEDASIGKYKCKYQDSTIIAYSNDIETTYSKGSYVYILVPNNDLSKQKTILGTTKKLGTDYINQVQEEAIYETIGNNVIIINENYYLDTNNKDYVYKIYDADDVSTSYILNIEAFEEYIRQVNYMYLSCNIKTSIAPNKQTNGHYGIRCKVVFRDNSTGENVIRTYVIDEDSMTGNPYRLVSGNKQFSYFEVDGSNFIRVDSIEIFNSGFPAATGTTTQTRLNDGDILISNLYLGAASALPEDAVNGISISFYTPKGSFFPREAISGDEISVTAQVRVKGKLVSSTDSISFYWGRAKSNIMTTSREYNKYLGRGWECLNNYNVSILEDEDQDEELIEWVSGSDTINIKLEDVPARDNEYKVAILYDSTIVTKKINIRNLMNGFELSIESSSGVNFYYDIGHPTLTCKIDNQDVVAGYVFKWAYENNMGIVQELPVTTELNNDYDTAVNNYQTLVNNINAGIRFKNESEQELIQLEETVDSFKQKQRVKDNKIYDVQVKEITTFGIFRCSVYKLQNNVETFIGTASITLFNTLSGDGRYSLIINNGTAAYQYDVNGLSPNHATLEKPVEIQALSFTVYDNTGQELSEDILSHCKIRWAFPVNNTMLEDILEDEHATYDDEHNYRYYDGMTSMPYGIVNRYAVDKQRNQIKLTVTYKGMVLNAETQFTFTKNGNPGTNGTDFFVRLLPNTKMNKPPQFPQITKIGNSYVLNYGLGNTDSQTIINAGTAYQLFKIEIWHNGELAWTGLQKGENSSLINDSNIRVNSIKWKVMKNKYSTNSEDYSNFVINNGNEQTGLITLNNFNNVKRAAANILQCAIELYFSETRQTKLFYGVIPIATATTLNNNFKVSIEDYTGFRNVLYSTDGTAPEYDSSLPFEFICLEKIHDIWEDVSLVSGTHSISYEPTSYGSIKYLNQNNQMVELNTNQLLLADESQELKKNQFNYIPNNRYNGECVNNSVSCIFKQNNIQVGVINLPIYFLLNRYGFDNLNDWDGNKIEINDNDGYILAPQMGAGKKEQDNSFTGVVMGEVKMPSKGYSNTGLFGYSSGSRSFFLNSENGSALFGKAGIGQITIDPSANRALLYSGNYWKNYNEKTGLPSSYNSWNENKAGLLIDLTTPTIKYGNGKFELDANGYLHTTGMVASGMSGTVTQNGVEYNIASTNDISTAVNNYRIEVNGIVGNLQDQIDGQIMSWYVELDHEPTLNDLPASEWTTENERKKHEGDIFFNKTTGYAYRFLKENNVWVWKRIADTDIEKAMAAASEAQDTADGKKRVFTATPYPPYDKGDLWTQGANGDIYVCTNSKETGVFVTSDWVKASKYTDDSALNAFKTGDYATFVLNTGNEFTSVNNKINTKVTTFYQEEAPATANQGDLWIDTNDKNKLYRYNGTIWETVRDTDIQQALVNAANAQSTADGKIMTYAQDAPPTQNLDFGDLWIDTNNNNKMSRWNGTQWVELTDTSELNAFKNGDYATFVTNINATVDKKITTFYQSTAPSKANAGDLWINTTNNGNKLYRYNGSNWIEVQDKGIQDALTAAGDAQATADSKIVTYAQPAAPTESLDVGDLWIDTDDYNKMYRWSGESWVAYTDTSSLQTFLNNTYKQDIQTLERQIDGKIDTWYQEQDPSLSWASADYTEHTGDLWYKPSDSTTKRWDGTQWLEQAAPQEVFDAIDGKAQIFITTPTVPYNEGDLWFNSSTSDIMTCVNSRTTGSYTASDWQKRNKYTDDAAVTNLNNILNQQEIFNRLTNNGTVRGVFFGNTEQTKNQLYINADYIATGVLKSNNYAEDAATGKATAGTEIILSNGSIKSKNFNVDSQGNLTATGANITGDITATSITLLEGASIKQTDVSGLSTQLNNIKNTADTAGSNASSALSTVNGWKYGNTTYINGGEIYTRSITANQIDVDNLFAQNITATGTISGATLTGASLSSRNGGYVTTITGGVVNCYQYSNGVNQIRIDYDSIYVNKGIDSVRLSTSELKFSQYSTEKHTRVAPDGIYVDGETVATQTWVQSQGYLTSHQSLSGYMPKSGGTFTGRISTDGINVKIKDTDYGGSSSGTDMTLTTFIKNVIKHHVKSNSRQNF